MVQCIDVAPAPRTYNSMHFFNLDAAPLHSPYEVPPGNLYQHVSHFGKLRQPPPASSLSSDGDACDDRSESFRHSHVEAERSAKSRGQSPGPEALDNARGYSIDSEGRYVTRPKLVEDNLEILDVDAEGAIGLHKRASLQPRADSDEEGRRGTVELDDILKRYKTKKAPTKKAKETDLHKIKFRRDKPI